MTSLMKDISDGVRLIQLMVRLVFLFTLLTENVGCRTGNHG